MAREKFWSEKILGQIRFLVKTYGPNNFLSGNKCFIPRIKLGLNEFCVQKFGPKKSLGQKKIVSKILGQKKILARKDFM